MSQLRVNTAEMRGVQSKCNELRSSSSSTSMATPSGFDYSQGSAETASTLFKEGVSAFSTAIGNLADAIQIVMKHYQNVDDIVVHDFSKHKGEMQEFEKKCS